jgi:Domain of unknown function (DUF2431)
MPVNWRAQALHFVKQSILPLRQSDKNQGRKMYEFRAGSLTEAVRLTIGNGRLAESGSPQSKKLAKCREHYPFGTKVAAGPALLIGEGNFSFALSLARLRTAHANALTATSYEP